MTRCDTCGREYPSTETMSYGGNNYNVCSECAPKVRENPSGYLSKKGETGGLKMDASNMNLPKCEACGRHHSNHCEMIEYSGKKFNVCGECIVGVRENPADFLAGKEGTQTQDEAFNPCGPNK